MTAAFAPVYAAADPVEDFLAGLDIRGRGVADRGEQAHEVRQRLDALAAVIEAGTRIELQLRAVAGRTVLVREQRIGDPDLGEQLGGDGFDRRRWR